MKLFFFATSFIVMSFTFGQTKKLISPNDFTKAMGSWKGSLTYLDYSSGKPYTMPANIVVTKNQKVQNEIIIEYIYPNEPKANGKDTLKIKKNGTMLNNADVFSITTLKDGTIQIITDEKGEDGNDNRKAILRHIYSFNNSKFTNRKEVQFIGTDKWIQRNEYTFVK
jgi:hypothetical protein